MFSSVRNQQRRYTPTPSYLNTNWKKSGSLLPQSSEYFKDKPIRHVDRTGLLRRLVLYTLILGLLIFWIFGGFKRWFSPRRREPGYDSPGHVPTPGWFSKTFEGKLFGKSCPQDLTFGCIATACSTATEPDVLVKESKRKGVKTLHFASPRQSLSAISAALTDPVIQIPYIRDSKHAEKIVDLIKDSGVSQVVFHGLVKGILDLPPLIKRGRGKLIQILFVWHGTPGSHGVDHGPGGQDGLQEAQVLQQLINLARDKYVDRIGVSKEGLAEPLSAMGIDAQQVLAFPPEVDDLEIDDRTAGPKKTNPILEGLNKVIDVNKVKEKLPLSNGQWAPVDWVRPRDDKLHIGINSKDHRWRGNLYPQLLALCLVPNSILHIFGNYVPPTYIDLCPGRNNTILHHPETDLTNHMKLVKQMDLNMYVFVSDSAPFSLLESLALGVPALTSPTHSLFSGKDQESKTLSKLMVEQFDNPALIAKRVKQVVTDPLIKKSIPNFMANYRKKAQTSWKAFLAGKVIQDDLVSEDEEMETEGALMKNVHDSA